MLRRRGHTGVAVKPLCIVVCGIASLAYVLSAASAHAQSQMAAPTASTVDSAPVRTIEITTDEGTIPSIDISPDGKMIVFDMLGQIFTLRIGCPSEARDGCGKPRQLTDGPAYNGQAEWMEAADRTRSGRRNAAGPRFSKDGRFIVFRRNAAGHPWRIPVGCTTGESAGCVPEPASAEEQLITESAADRWRIVAVHRLSAPEPGGNRCRWTETYRIVERATGTESHVTPAWEHCPAAEGIETNVLPAIAPDGGSLITAAGGKLYRVAISSGRVTPIPFKATIRLRIRPLRRFPHRVPEDSLVVARRIEHPRLSPDGSRLAFSALGRVWIMAFPGGVPERLTKFERQAENRPVWSPDGRRVAFITWTDEGGGVGHVYAVPVDGHCAGATVARRVGPCAPVRLTREAAHYSDIVYSPDGTRLVLVMRSLRWLHRQRSAVDYSSHANGEAEMAWIPAAGGAPVTITMLKPDVYACINSRGTALASLHFRSSSPDSVLHFQADPDSARRAFLRKIPIVDIDWPPVRADTALMLWIDRAVYERECADVLLSPDGRRALVWVNQRELLVIDPRNPLPGVRAPTLGQVAASAHRALTAEGAGAEFPAWSPDGRSFTYSSGRYFYRYDLRVADSLIQDSVARAGTSNPVRGPAYVPVPVPITLTGPRDLPQGTIAFRNARIITMRGDEVLERGDLVVRDRRIVAVGPVGRVTIPRDAHVIDATGRTIMPGLVDLHNHVNPLQVIHRTRVWQHEANLAYGVLTSRDPQATGMDFLTYEDLQATGELLAPRSRNTGRGIGSISFDTLATLDEARAVVARYADVYGVQYLKEYDLAARDARQRLVAAAAERGLNVVAHGSFWSRLVQNAIDGYGGFDHIHPSIPLYHDMAQLVALTGITLAHGGFYPLRYQAHFEPLRRSKDARKIARWYPPAYFAFYSAQWSQGQTERLRPMLEEASQVAQRLGRVIASGGRAAIGGHGDPPGLATHFQLWAYAELGGIPPMEALRSATVRGAEALGLDQDIGSLEVGKLGDLLVLDGNPLESIRATKDLRYVLFNGRLYDATTLDELWPRQVTRSPLWWWKERSSIHGAQ